MNFVKFTRKETYHDTNRISLNKSYLVIGSKAFEYLGKPEKVDVFYDVESLIIKLTPSDTGLRVTQGINKVISIKGLQKVMPLGKYYREENIFKLKNK